MPSIRTYWAIAWPSRRHRVDDLTARGVAGQVREPGRETGYPGYDVEDAGGGGHGRRPVAAEWGRRGPATGGVAFGRIITATFSWTRCGLRLRRPAHTPDARSVRRPNSGIETGLKLIAAVQLNVCL